MRVKCARNLQGTAQNGPVGAANTRPCSWPAARSCARTRQAACRACAPAGLPAPALRAPWGKMVRHRKRSQRLAQLLRLLGGWAPRAHGTHRARARLARAQRAAHVLSARMHSSMMRSARPGCAGQHPRTRPRYSRSALPRACPVPSRRGNARRAARARYRSSSAASCPRTGAYFFYKPRRRFARQHLVYLAVYALHTRADHAFHKAEALHLARLGKFHQAGKNTACPRLRSGCICRLSARQHRHPTLSA